MSIQIPTDTQGYVLLKCPLCGELFKLHVNECQSEDVLAFNCPICGLISEESYITEDVLELVMIMAKNYANELINKSLKKMEKSSKYVKVKVSSKSTIENEPKLIAGIDDMIEIEYRCCKKHSKLRPIYNLQGSYCPYCGVRND